MSDLLARIKQQAAGLPELKNLEDVDIIRIEAGAVAAIPAYLEQKGWSKIILVADDNTYSCAGESLESLLKESGAAVHVTHLQPDSKGDVLADEVSLIQTILDIQRHNAQVVLAVGGGTIHDISRYAAYTAGIPFVAVPTAPSVDGFNSKGAPIIVRGEKITIPAIGPSAIFADTDILMKAPAVLTAAGFGDILGKYTSLFDWRFGSLTADEPYMEISEEITRVALQKCVDHVQLIADRTEEGVTILMEALIESGLAMLLFGQSHPASGSEHHLSHYWEMEYIRLGRKQLLHGAKVGAACIQISRLYRGIMEEGREAWNHGASGRAIYENWDVITQALAKVPSEETLAELLQTVGGPVSPDELGITPDLLNRSLQEAHHVRINRHTLLRAYNERE